MKLWHHSLSQISGYQRCEIDQWQSREVFWGGKRGREVVVVVGERRISEGEGVGKCYMPHRKPAGIKPPTLPRPVCWNRTCDRWPFTVDHWEILRQWESCWRTVTAHDGRFSQRSTGSPPGTCRLCQCPQSVAGWWVLMLPSSVLLLLLFWRWRCHLCQRSRPAASKRVLLHVGVVEMMIFLVVIVFSDKTWKVPSWKVTSQITPPPKKKKKSLEKLP